MQQENLFELQSGLNQFVITQKDLGTTSSKIPILNLPEGLKIKNIFINTLQPFRSTLAPNQSSIDACMKYRMMIGTSENTQDFLTWTEEASIVGESNNNTGDYFNSPNANDVISKVVLENWAIPRVWTSGGNLTTVKSHLAGCGTQTAGLSFGGFTGSVSAVTEEYNGSSWSAGGSLSTARSHLAGCGNQTSGLSFGGYTSGAVATCEEYNGSSWSGGGALNTARYSLAGCGTQTAGLSFGGYISDQTNTCEEYNGSSWSYAGNLNVALSTSSGFGTQTAGLNCGGYNGTLNLADTEAYNGTTWEISNNLNYARRQLAGCGTQSSGLIFGGYTGIYSLQTVEEYNGISWILSNNLNDAKRLFAGCGSQSAGLSFGGSDSSTTEEYDAIDFNEVSLSGEMILNITVI